MNYNKTRIVLSVVSLVGFNSLIIASQPEAQPAAQRKKFQLTLNLPEIDVTLDCQAPRTRSLEHKKRFEEGFTFGMHLKAPENRRYLSSKASFAQGAIAEQIKAAIAARDHATTQALFKAHKDIHVYRFPGYTSFLHLAAATDDPKMLDIVFATQLAPDERDEHGNTALHIATTFNCAHSVRALLDRGLSPNEMNEKNLIPLHLAPTPAIRKLLLAYGSNTLANPLNDQDIKANAELTQQVARHAYALKVMQGAMQLFAHIQTNNMRDLELHIDTLRATSQELLTDCLKFRHPVNGATPLIAGLKAKNDPAVQLLLAYNAPVHTFDASDKNALDYAKDSLYLEKIQARMALQKKELKARLESKKTPALQKAAGK